MKKFHIFKDMEGPDLHTMQVLFPGFQVSESLTSNFEYGVTFYHSCDDGSHPYGDFKLRFDNPEDAHKFGEQQVEREWQDGRKDAADTDWYDKCVERNIYVVECYRKKGD
jgi:hypothetical protein